MKGDLTTSFISKFQTGADSEDTTDVVDFVLIIRTEK